MIVRTVVIAHSETLAAEAIAVALSRYPAFATVAVATTAAEAERGGARADAVAIDLRIPGANRTVRRLIKRGVRVVVIGCLPSDDGHEDRVVVAPDAPVARLASALAPELVGSIGRPPILSEREDEVLRLAAKGLVAKQIARVLGISPKTVEQHKTRAFKRLGVPNQAAAVAMLSERMGGPWSLSTT